MPSKVRAFRTNGSGHLALVEQALPQLGSQDVLLDMLAVSLNFRDIPFIRGDERRPPNNGRIPFSDGVGRVRAVGEAVTRVHVGDRVSPSILPKWIDGPLNAKAFQAGFASTDRDGMMAEALVVEESCLVHVPQYLSDAEAACLPCAALTAWHALAEAGTIRAGGTVAIESTGGVAVFALQISAAMGLRPIVISRSDEKLAKAELKGAWRTVNSVRYANWDEQVFEITEGEGAHLVLDMGVTNGLPRSCRAAAFEGSVAIIGVVDGWHTTFDIGPVMNKNLRVQGVETGSRMMFERMNSFLAHHQIRPAIADVFRFEEPEKALDCLAASPFGKVVITV